MNSEANIPPIKAVYSWMNPIVVKKISGICMVWNSTYAAENKKQDLSKAAIPTFKYFIFTYLIVRTSMRFESTMNGIR